MARRPVNDSAPPAQQDAPTRDADLQEAYDRHKHCEDFEQTARSRFIDDLKMAVADSYNGYQWPNDLRRTREVDDRPTLTLNGIRQHNRQITNDAKQNKPGLKALPTGGGATYESAGAITAMFRHIEYISNATTAYDTATWWQVNAGWGYIRVDTAYTNDENFDQDILIRRVKDPLMIYLDPDAIEVDRSDAKYGIVFEDIPRKEFERDPRFKEYKNVPTADPLGDMGWISKDYVRIADYYRVVEKPDTLYALPEGFGGQKQFKGGFIRKSFLLGQLKDKKIKIDPATKKALLAAVENDPQVQSREVIAKNVEWMLIIGNEIADRQYWPGKYIPIVPVWGEETLVEGEWDCVSHTRTMIDAQRMYNYAASSAVEFMGLQTKTPWLVAVESIEELETYWNEANRINTSALPYKSLREDGSEIPPPQRIQPPAAAPIYATQMQASLADLLMTSGQYAAQMGGQGNERSGKAIGERQRQSDTATYHFVDGLAIAIRHVGRIILDLIPHIYDTARTLQVMADDESMMELALDPKAQQVYQTKLGVDGKIAQHILNVNVGKYEVQTDTGPNYATRREETAEAMKLILTQNPAMSSILGDIFLRALDFEHADEAAERLKRLVPPVALGEGPSQQEQSMQTAIQNLQNLLANSMTELAETKLKLRGKEAKDEIGVYSALTDRLKVLVDAAAKGEAQITPDTLRPIVMDLLDEAGAINMDQVSIDNEMLGNSTNSPGLPPAATRQQPPVAGAKQDFSGNWWARDFAAQKNSGYRRVT